MSEWTFAPPELSDDRFLGSTREAMSAALARNWWALALRGALAMVFGLAALLVPFATIDSLMFVFALYLLADGTFAIVAGFHAASRRQRSTLLTLEGLIDLLAACVMIAMPGPTVFVLLLVLGLWALVSGSFMLAASLRLRAGHGAAWLALSGLLSILWGILVLKWPITGALIMTLWLGCYALAFGALLLSFAFALRERRGGSRDLGRPATS